MDNVRHEKEEAMASFERLRAIVRFRQISEFVLVLALISWSTGRFPAAMASACLVDFSEYLLNHHVVFLIGNAIIVLLFMICRQSDAGGGDFYDDYVKFSEAAVPQPESAAEESIGGGGGDCEKQIVVREDERVSISESDEVDAAIEKAKRQLQKFQRTQSEKLKREICAREPPVFRRSETDSHRETVSCRAAEMETLSNEEFRMKIEAFIDAHRRGRRNGTKGIESYPLLKMA